MPRDVKKEQALIREQIKKQKTLLREASKEVNSRKSTVEKLSKELDKLKALQKKDGLNKGLIQKIENTTYDLKTAERMLDEARELYYFASQSNSKIQKDLSDSQMSFITRLRMFFQTLLQKPVQFVQDLIYQQRFKKEEHSQEEIDEIVKKIADRNRLDLTKTQQMTEPTRVILENILKNYQFYDQKDFIEGEAFFMSDPEQIKEYDSKLLKEVVELCAKTKQTLYVSFGKNEVMKFEFHENAAMDLSEKDRNGYVKLTEQRVVNTNGELSLKTVSELGMLSVEHNKMTVETATLNTILRRMEEQRSSMRSIAPPEIGNYVAPFGMPDDKTQEVIDQAVKTKYERMVDDFEKKYGTPEAEKEEKKEEKAAETKEEKKTEQAKTDKEPEKTEELKKEEPSKQEPVKEQEPVRSEPAKDNTQTARDPKIDSILTQLKTDYDKARKSKNPPKDKEGRIAVTAQYGKHTIAIVGSSTREKSPEYTLDGQKICNVQQKKFSKEKSPAEMMDEAIKHGPIIHRKPAEITPESMAKALVYDSRFKTDGFAIQLENVLSARHEDRSFSTEDYAARISDALDTEIYAKIQEAKDGNKMQSEIKEAMDKGLQTARSVSNHIIALEHAAQGESLDLIRQVSSELDKRDLLIIEPAFDPIPFGEGNLTVHGQTVERPVKFQSVPGEVYNYRDCCEAESQEYQTYDTALKKNQEAVKAEVAQQDAQGEQGVVQDDDDPRRAGGIWDNSLEPAQDKPIDPHEIHMPDSFIR